MGDDHNLQHDPQRDLEEEIDRLRAQVAALQRELEQERDEERNLLRTLIDNAPDSIYVKDTEGRFVLANPASAHNLGAASVAEQIGKSDDDFLSRNQAGRLHAEEQQIIATGRPLINQEASYIDSATGKRRWLLVTKVPLRDRDGNVIGIVGINRDITEIRELTQALRRYALRLEVLHEIDRAILTAQSAEEVAQIAMDYLRYLTPCNRVSVNLFDFEANTGVVFAASIDGPSAMGQGHHFSLNDTGRLPTLLQGDAVLVRDLASEPDRSPLATRLLAEGVRTHISLPLLYRGKLIGSLYLGASQPGALTQDHVEIAQEIAAPLAVAIQQAQLNDALRRHSEDLEAQVAARTAELHRMVEQIEAILRNSPDPTLLLRADGLIETGNPALFDMLGYHTDQIAGQTPAALADVASAPRLNAALRAVAETGRVQRLTITARRADGSTLDADVALAPIYEGGAVTGMVFALRDISAFKEVERMKDAFIDNVSHELRTPIASLKLYHELLDRNPYKRSRYMDRLRRETERLHMIVEDVLYLSRLDRNQVALKLQPLDLNRLVEQYVVDRTPLARSRGLTITFALDPDLPSVNADSELLGRALGILLTNALNYTPAGGRVEVWTRAREDADCTWAGFTVSDNGPGIVLEEQAHLFERFFRGKAAQETNEPGTGLGLAMVKEIVDRHGGRVEFTSGGVPGEGAAFSVWLASGDPPAETAA